MTDKEKDNKGKGGGPGTADLHVHTTFSDGMLTPAQVVDLALGMGMSAIAITDHDCIEGIAPAMDAARGTDLEIVPGVEISAAIREDEIHILGYFVDWRKGPLEETLQKVKINRVKRMEKIIALLGESGIRVDEDKVFGTMPEGTVGRLHLARIMVEGGLVRNVKEAFDRYIGDGKPCGVRHDRIDFTRAINIIRDSGGVPVIAHPATMGKDEYLPDYVRAGIRGMEAFHIKHRKSVNKKYLDLAERYDLIVTGGSDCHGMGPDKILLGKVTVGREVVEKLREESEKIRGGKR
jgi:3',5'-nucleoside bisphosphate phosphatase